MRRGGQPQTTTPVKVLGDHAGRIRRLEFRKPRVELHTAQVLLNGTQSIPSGAGITPVVFTEIYHWATTGMVDIAGEPTRITAVVPGMYIVNAAVTWVNVTGTAGMNVYGSVSPVTGTGQEQKVSSPFEQSSSWVARMEAGDYIYLGVRQNSGGPVDVANCVMQATLINPSIPAV